MLRAGIIVDLLWMLDEDQVRKGNRVGQSTGIRDGRGMGNSVNHMTTLLEQTLKICTTPGLEGKIQHILTVYTNVFSKQEGKCQKTGLVKR